MKQVKMRARLAAAAMVVVLVACGAQGSTTSAKKKKTAVAAGSAKGRVSTRSASGRSAGGSAGKSSSRSSGKGKTAAVSSKGRSVPAVEPSAESKRLSSAFTASAQLRPMAQQLAATRSPAAYAGVRAYAGQNPGEGAAAADLALGHAAMLDRRFGDAETSFRQAGQSGEALDDYADYLAAQAAVQGGHAPDAVPLLEHFAEKHPGSLFVPTAPILLANAYLAGGNGTMAVRVLQPLAGTQQASHVDYRSTLARAYQASGDPTRAATLFRGIYLGDPLSPEAANAKTQLAVLSAPLNAAERKQHADTMFNAKQYGQAALEYRALQKDEASLSQADRDALTIYAAVCDLRLNRLTRSDVSRLPVTGDDSAALKLYLQSELARNEKLPAEHDSLVQQIEASYPKSRWLEEALYSGGNMHIVRGETPEAIAAYTELFTRFPRSTYAPNAHWHAAWLSYRLRKYPEAAKLMDEQIQNYPAGSEIPGAIYWRGRLHEDVERNFSQAANYYRALSAAYIDSYYAMLGRQRLAVLGDQPSTPPAPPLAMVRPVEYPHLTAELPENDPHLIKARLLANAALNEYIRPELQLSDPSGSWSALAEAEIYQSFGENSRALQAMKRAKLPFFSIPISEVPMAYWQIVFPRPYWSQITAKAQEHALDPYLVASLIRQESEFNPGAMSKANAYGLMQLLPSVGKSFAKAQGDKHFSTNELLDPATNISLGTADLKKTLDRYNGTVEYALASYNAGDSPVHRWIATNDYKDIPEWVESIPYTETRDYVQAIIRNREMYRGIYGGK